MRVFITGGAGFIGSRLVDRLSKSSNYEILVYDNLHAQVHGDNADLPVFSQEVRFIKGDINDTEALNAAISTFKPTAVAHLASETGTGQSLDEITRYVDTNIGGTARLLEAVTNNKCMLDWFVLTSSRSVYGEGAYLRPDGTITTKGTRTHVDMQNGRFGVYDATGKEMTFRPTNSTMEPNPLSVYATTKLTQEYLVQNLYDNSDTRLLIYRFQNVYGAGQSLTNPYTGVLSIFLARLMAGKPIGIYEDGAISRDFIHVDDVVSAVLAGIKQPISPCRALDIGSGVTVRIYDVAMYLVNLIGTGNVDLPITGEFRPGDIRHAVADISYATDLLDWTPETPIEEGLRRLHEWAALSFPHD